MWIFNGRLNIKSLLLAVVLLVNADAATVKQEILPNTILQFHGDESDDFCRQFHQPFWKSIPVKDKAAEVASYNAEGGFLFDAWSDDQYGGTGHQFDWSRLPAQRDYKLILAGGLRPDNVADAVAQVRPYMVDVSGGVESSPGIKDEQKVTIFVANAKQA